jgi:hypothetical protein
MGRLNHRFRAAAAPGAAKSAAVLGTAAVLGLTALGLGGQLRSADQPASAADVSAAAVPSTAAGTSVAHTSEVTLTTARMLPWAVPASRAGAKGGQPALAGSFGRIILPDLLIVAPRGLTKRQVTRLGAITGVGNMITFDGAQITAGGRSVSVLGVNPATFRSWVPVRTASDQAVWTELSRGEFVAATSVGHRLHLRPGQGYQLAGAVSEKVGFGSSARLALNGVDLLVNQAMSRKLGLVHKVAALISAPGVSMTGLTAAVSAILGPSGRLESLRSEQLPVTGAPAGQVPSTYLELFKESAARYCPGLSWTVLAAIGQIESADGTNEGPSSAGALGPMQFLPSTWAIWGIDGFGQKGAPDVTNPYDAVPSAARLLCADGAAAGGQHLYKAIFDYNHAGWYVREVLGLAARYAAE